MKYRTHDTKVARTSNVFVHHTFVSLLIAASMLLAANAASALKTTSEQKLIPPSAEDNSEAGWAVDVQGGTAVVGAPIDSTLAASAGAVHIYTLGAGGFEYATTLTASDGVAGDELGIAVEIDGDTLAAGAYHRWPVVGEPGRAYMFEWNGSAWIEDAKLTAPDGVAKDAFGWAIALDGDYVAVGAPRAWSGGPSGDGGVYIFKREAGEWTFDTKLTRSGDHSFGWALDLDGDTLAVGSSLSPYERVSVYVRDGDGDWNLEDTLVDPAGAEEFGNAVAIDGNDLLVAAWFDTTDGNYGSAFFFRRQSGDWDLVQKVNSPGGELAEAFGEAVALDGDLAVITDGSFDIDEEFYDVGAAYLYRRKGDTWAPAGKVLPSDYATYTNYFGTAAAIDGGRVLIGAAYAWDEPSETAPGAAYSYEIASGSKLIIKNASPDNEFKNKVVFRAKGLNSDLPLPGSPNDPTCIGGASASIEITSATSGESFTQGLPCANWEQGPTGYRYKDSELDDGACRSVAFEPGRGIKAKCSGAGPSVLDFDLESGVPQAPIAVKVTLGTASFCTTFGGTVKDDGTDGEVFKAVNAGAVGECD